MKGKLASPLHLLKCADNESRPRALAGRVDVHTIDLNHRNLSDDQYNCFTAIVVNSNHCIKGPSWIIDFASSCQVPCEESLFVTHISISERSVEIETNAESQISGYDDVLLQVTTGDEAYRCHFQQVLYIPKFEYSLLLVATMDLKK